MPICGFLTLPICAIGAATGWMLEARRGCMVGIPDKIGLSTPPIETDRGWLVFYHGVRHTAFRVVLYRLGLALFDLENPEKCLLRGDSWIFGPEAGVQTPPAMLTTSFSPADTRWMPTATRSMCITRAADCSIALAQASVRSLLEWLDANGSSERRQRTND